MRVLKTHWGYIDLDHVAIISEPVFVDRMGNGGYFIEFHIVLLFKETPLFFSHELRNGEEYFSEHDNEDGEFFSIAMIDGSRLYPHSLVFDSVKQNEMLAMKNFREEHWDPLYQAWANKP